MTAFDLRRSYPEELELKKSRTSARSSADVHKYFDVALCTVTHHYCQLEGTHRFIYSLRRSLSSKDW